MTSLQHIRFDGYEHTDSQQISVSKKFPTPNKFSQFKAFDDISLSSSIANNASVHLQIQIHPPIINLQHRHKQLDNEIQKLTQRNKFLLQRLKQQNQELTKRVNKQKFKIKRSYTQSKGITVNIKETQAITKQLQNSYKQIQFYKQTISILKEKEISLDDQGQIDNSITKLKQKNDQIQSIQKQIRTQNAIKLQQQKALQKIQHQQVIQQIKKLDQDLINAKHKLKQVKKNLSKRQQLQKKQHLYLMQIESLLKRYKKEDQLKQYQLNQNQLNHNLYPQKQITQQEWIKLKSSIQQQKQKYQQYGKKLTYLNFVKSRQTKHFQQQQLKFKQKQKILQRLNSKLTQINKLVELRPKPILTHRVLGMDKLKDIVKRQGTLDAMMGRKRNIIQFKKDQNDLQMRKWELENIYKHGQIESKQQKQ